jgi:hypothetical protein
MSSRRPASSTKSTRGAEARRGSRRKAALRLVAASVLPVAAVGLVFLVRSSPRRATLQSAIAGPVVPAEVPPQGTPAPPVLAPPDDARLIGRWKVESDSAEASRESLRQIARLAVETNRQISPEAAVQDDVEGFVAQAARAVAATEWQITRESIVVLIGGSERRRLAYTVKGRDSDEMLLETTGANELMPALPMRVRFVGEDRIEVAGSQGGPSVALLFRRLPAGT